MYYCITVQELVMLLLLLLLVLHSSFIHFISFIYTGTGTRICCPALAFGGHVTTSVLPFTLILNFCLGLIPLGTVTAYNVVLGLPPLLALLGFSVFTGPC